MPDSVEVEYAWAKINLGLKVVGRRPDGFHEIRSLMQCVDVADRLFFRPATVADFSCSDATLPLDGDNLVRRAVDVFHAELEKAESGTPSRAWSIHLEKHLPVGAGLGGGSADAAAVLRGLNRIYGFPFTWTRLEEMGARLGSDVPFLVQGGTAVVRGRGEVIQPVSWSAQAYYVLVYPGVGVGTAWAYGQLNLDALTVQSPYLRFISSLKSGGCVEGRELFPLLENDFQELVERAKPIVAAAGAALINAGACWYSMSGSGSTVFGIFDDRPAASRAAEALQAQGFRSFFCVPRSAI
jgi:4-diphosphocytidyl-2-C-methyl-D-erythritol kinase